MVARFLKLKFWDVSDIHSLMIGYFKITAQNRPMINALVFFRRMGDVWIQVYNFFKLFELALLEKKI